MATTTTVYCDNCANEVEGDPIVVLTTEEFLPSPDPDISNYTFEFCSWECLKDVTTIVIQQLEQPAPEPKPEPEPEPKKLRIKRPAVEEVPANNTHGPISMYNNPYDKRDEDPQDDVRVGEIRRR